MVTDMILKNAVDLMRDFGVNFFVDDRMLDVPVQFIITEKEDGSIVYHFELPGMDKDKTNISFKNRTMKISGEFKDVANEGEKVLVSTSKRKKKEVLFSAVVPEQANVDSARASYKDGILYVEFDKKEELKEKSILIK